jgi:hypothetical protein
MPLALALRLLALSSCLMSAACSQDSRRSDRSSVTVKLPPVRPYAPQPSFSFGQQTGDLPLVKEGR